MIEIGDAKKAIRKFSEKLLYELLDCCLPKQRKDFFKVHLSIGLIPDNELIVLINQIENIVVRNAKENKCICSYSIKERYL